jgi:hypothetical protein
MFEFNVNRRGIKPSFLGLCVFKDTNKGDAGNGKGDAGNVMQAGRQAGRQWLRKTPKISDGNFESRPPPPKKKVAFG